MQVESVIHLKTFKTTPLWMNNLHHQSEIVPTAVIFVYDKPWLNLR